MHDGWFTANNGTVIDSVEAAVRSKAQKSAQRVAYNNHALIDNQVVALKDQVVRSEVFSTNPDYIGCRMVNASIDVGAVHLLRFSLTGPSKTPMGDSVIDTRATLTKTTARVGIQLLGWMKQVQSMFSGVHVVGSDEYAEALGVSEAVYELLEGIEEQQLLTETQEGIESSEAFMRRNTRFWDAYREQVQGIESASFDVFVNMAIGSFLLNLDKETQRYYIALLNGPPSQMILSQLDYLERFHLWKKHESEDRPH